MLEPTRVKHLTWVVTNIRLGCPVPNTLAYSASVSDEEKNVLTLIPELHGQGFDGARSGNRERRFCFLHFCDGDRTLSGPIKLFLLRHSRSGKNNLGRFLLQKIISQLYNL